MLIIPKIIHQIWSEKHHPLPEYFRAWAETWKTKHPGWEYIHWDEKSMNDFIRKEYPHLCDFYYSLPFDIQRWDALRVLVMDKMGGLYIDFDYECLKNVEPLLENRTCCIGLEPDTHSVMYGIPRVLNMAFLACVPGDPFIKKIIEKIFSETTRQWDGGNKSYFILKTTGPFMLSGLYETMSRKDREAVSLIPAGYVTPFDAQQIQQVKAGIENEELKQLRQAAYAVHYFTTSWLPGLNAPKTMQQPEKIRSLATVNRYRKANCRPVCKADMAYPLLGEAIYYYLYARYTGKTGYEEKAGDLLDVVYGEITADMPLRLKEGLLGIGCGLLYLLRNGFVEGDEDEIFHEIDERIFGEIFRAGSQTPEDRYGLLYYLGQRIDRPDIETKNRKSCLLKNQKSLIYLLDNLAADPGGQLPLDRDTMKELRKFYRKGFYRTKIHKILYPERFRQEAHL